jgi:hypothetical protein
LVNLTCLVPTENPQVGRARAAGPGADRSGTSSTSASRWSPPPAHELVKLSERIHILEGFVNRLRRAGRDHQDHPQERGQGRRGQKIMKRFGLERRADRRHLGAQALPPGASSRSWSSSEELAEKKKRVRDHQAQLGEADSRALGHGERKELHERRRRPTARQAPHQDPGGNADEPELTAEDSSLTRTPRGGHGAGLGEAPERAREGPEQGRACARATRCCPVWRAPPGRAVVFFSNFGTATCAHRGHPGYHRLRSPIQKLFKLSDGERIMAAFSLDPRLLDVAARRKGSFPRRRYVVRGRPATAYALSLRSARPSSSPAPGPGGKLRAGLKAATSVVYVMAVDGDDDAGLAAPRARRALLCKLEEVNYLSGRRQGRDSSSSSTRATLRVGFCAVTKESDVLTMDKRWTASRRSRTSRYELSTRGGKGLLSDEARRTAGAGDRAAATAPDVRRRGKLR